MNQSVPDTVRLLLNDKSPGQGSVLRIGLVSGMASAYAHQTATFTPASPAKTLCLNLRLSMSLATDDSEHHGRGWLTILIQLDQTIQAIARHRQRLGLTLNSSRR